MINITFGRILGIISNNKKVSNQTIMLEVIMDLGKEKIKNIYLIYIKKRLKIVIL
jgi:hypothetical protein